MDREMSDTEPDTFNDIGDDGQTNDVVLQRDEDFWMEDSGLLIIEAENVKREIIRFRVSRWLLTDLSEIFSNVLAVPQPEEGSHENGIPVVFMPDRAEDVRNMLDGIMPKSFLPSPPSYEMVSACIRMGHKYMIERLTDPGLAFLQSHFTTDFDKWITSGFVPPSFSPKHAVGVVTLAHLTGTQSILPSALLACTMLHEEAILGFVDADGMQVTLDPLNMMRLWRAQGLLHAAKYDMVRSALGPVKGEGDCWVGDGCIRAAESAFVEYLGLEPKRIVPRHAFFSFDDVKDAFSENPLCDTCERKRRTHLLDEQRELWTRLPLIFGITVKGWPGCPPLQDDATSWAEDSRDPSEQEADDEAVAM